MVLEKRSHHLQLASTLDDIGVKNMDTSKNNSRELCYQESQSTEGQAAKAGDGVAQGTLVVGPALTTAYKNGEKDGRDCEAEGSF